MNFFYLFFLTKASLAFFQKFCQTQWPAPEEYSQLEAQTGLGRTDIVRWFKEHRSALKSGESLDWMDGLKGKELSEQNGRAADRQQCVSSEVMPAKRTFYTQSVESSQLKVYFGAFYHLHRCHFSGAGERKHANDERALEGVGAGQSPVAEREISPQRDGPESRQGGAKQSGGR